MSIRYDLKEEITQFIILLVVKPFSDLPNCLPQHRGTGLDPRRDVESCSVYLQKEMRTAPSPSSEELHSDIEWRESRGREAPGYLPHSHVTRSISYRATLSSDTGASNCQSSPAPKPVVVVDVEPILASDAS